MANKVTTRLKRGQAIKPQMRNYYSKDWYNKHYGSKRAAMSAYTNAMRNYKAKLSKLKAGR